MLNKANENMSKIVAKKIEWSTYKKDEKSAVVAAMKTVQIVKKLVDMPLLTDDGVLTQDVKDVIEKHMQ